MIICTRQSWRKVGFFALAGVNAATKLKARDETLAKSDGTWRRSQLRGARGRRGAGGGLMISELLGEVEWDANEVCEMLARFLIC